MKKRIILITGASSGLGKALALNCAQQGATVLLLSRKVQLLEKLYDEIVEKKYPKPIIIPFDLSTATAEAYNELKELIITHCPQLDTVVHNAASVGPLTPIELYSPKQWYETLQVNLHAPFHLTQTLLPILKQQKRSQIIFSLDTHAMENKAYWGAYGVSKKALLGLMETLAKELESSSVCVNAILPNPMNTPLRSKAFPGENINTVMPIESIIPDYINLIINNNNQNGNVIKPLGAMHEAN